MTRLIGPRLVRAGPVEQNVLQLLSGVKAGVIGQPGLRLTTFSAVYAEDLAHLMMLAVEKGTPLPKDGGPHVFGGDGVPRSDEVSLTSTPGAARIRCETSTSGRARRKAGMPGARSTAASDRSGGAWENQSRASRESQA